MPPRTRSSRRLASIAVLAAVVATLAAGCTTSAPAGTTGTTSASATATDQATGSASNTLFYDGFSGAAGTAVDAKNWTSVVKGDGGGNEELQYYGGGTENAALDGKGDLAITARAGSGGHTCWYGTCRYTSARITTAGKYSAKYGRVEARIKLPAGDAVFPAFWLLGADDDTDPWPASGEIDVLENVGVHPDSVTGSIHGPGFSTGGKHSGSFGLPSGLKLSDAFHTYAIVWSPDKIVWTVDGVPYFQQTKADLGTGQKWVFNKPFDIILNVAVIGDDATLKATTFPTTMLVDYVAVYRQ